MHFDIKLNKNFKKNLLGPIGAFTRRVVFSRNSEIEKPI